jgi:hypothetical protein
MSLSAFLPIKRDEETSSRPASAHLISSTIKDKSAPRVRPLRRWSWQKKPSVTSNESDDEWHHSEGPLIFITGSDLPAVIETPLKQPTSEGEEGDDEDGSISDAETVIHRPEALPFTPTGFTGEMPRFYALANEMVALPPPPSVLGVLIPGDQAEQLRAQVALARLELVEREEELARMKARVVREEEARKKVER